MLVGFPRLEDGVMVSTNRGLVAMVAVVALTVGGTPACSGGVNPLAPSGVAFFSFTDIMLGSGDLATRGTQISINYIAWIFEDGASENKGTQVDSGDGLTFVVGGNQTIGGFDQGVLGMRVDGIRQLVIPPDLGFGQDSSGAIPADATLVADVTLVDVQPLTTDTAPFSITDLSIGDGAVAAADDTLTAAFGGWLYDESRSDNKGAQFDSSAGFPFTLGAGQVIEGWEQGIPGMRVNGERRLIVPPELGFGDVQRGIIPPNSTLLFDITLLTVGPQ
jgi:FKBP-type peptidyl-prolyl cis-trans isomerase FkpA